MLAMKNSLRGFSFIEALVTLALVATSVLVAVPSFSNQIAKSRKISAIEQVVVLLSYSRIEAASKGHTVTFCTSADGVACSSGTTKWLIAFSDRNNNRQAEPGELLRSEPPDTVGTNYILKLSAHRNYLRFRPEGTAIESGSITLCPENNDNRQASQLIINFGGRVRIAPDTNSDGVPEDSDGSPVDCQSTNS